MDEASEPWIPKSQIQREFSELYSCESSVVFNLFIYPPSSIFVRPVGLTIPPGYHTPSIISSCLRFFSILLPTQYYVYI